MIVGDHDIWVKPEFAAQASPVYVHVPRLLAIIGIADLGDEVYPLSEKIGALREGGAEAHVALVLGRGDADIAYRLAARRDAGQAETQ
jgi:hypothetical protein